MDLTAAQELGFDTSRLERLRQAMLDDIARAGVDGVSLMIGRHGKLALDLVEGMADRKLGRPLDGDAVFATFAVSKQITSVVALMFVERGLLHLHQPIVEWLPQFNVPGKEKINLYHLLTNTSGLFSHYPECPHEDLNSIEKLTAYAARKPLEATPGERVSYSMFAVHAVIASLCVKADGGKRTFCRIMDEELFRPLGMRSAALGCRSDLLERLCPVRANFTDDTALAPQVLEGLESLLRTPGGEMPGAGCLMTTSDLYRFTEMLRNGGELDGARILSPATMKYMLRVHSDPSMRNRIWDTSATLRNWTVWPANQGLGFWIRGEEGVPPGPIGSLMSPRAYGGFGAGSAGFWVDPEFDLSIAFLSTGLLKGYAHLERLGRLTNMIVTAVVR